MTKVGARFLVGALLLLLLGAGATRDGGVAPVPGTLARLMPDGSVAVADAHDLVFYRISAGRLVEQRRWRAVDVSDWSVSGGRLYGITSDDTIGLFELPSGKPLRTFGLGAHHRDVFKLGDHAVSAFGDSLAATAGHGSVYFWRLGRPYQPARPDEGVQGVSVRAAALSGHSPVRWSHNGARLAFGTDTHGVHDDDGSAMPLARPCAGWVDWPPRTLFDAQSMAAVAVDCKVNDIAAWPRGLVWVGDFSAAFNALVLPADEATARTLKLPSPDGQVLALSAVAVTVDGKRLVVGDPYGRLWVADFATGRVVKSLRGQGDRQDIWSIDVDATTAVTTRREGANGVVELWPLE